ncbi:hypothetical protein N8500_07625 [Candidatus Puniceispirillum sp.]|nr:hypothetical protein [Candidatus Puniceispirillum sp.]
MKNIKNKIETVWAELLHQKSKNYLIRSKIDQNIAISNSNLSASFMGNRQLANHNTADIKYNLTKIAETKLPTDNLDKENIEMVFIQHQQKLNKRLLENSKDLFLALEQLQLTHKRVMKTNEEIIKFNTSLINSTSEILEKDQLPETMRLDKNQIISELDKIQKKQRSFDVETEKLITKAEQITEKNGKLSIELDIKREKINKNRKRISSLRADLSIFLE